MKKLVFSILLISGFGFLSAQTENKNSTQSQRGSLQGSSMGRMPDTSMRNTQSAERLTNPGNTGSPNYRNNMGFSNMPQNSTWRNMDLQEQRETVKNMSLSERNQLMQNIKENMAIEELGVPKESQEEFKILLKEYLNTQKEIKEKFRTDKKIDKLTDSEATKKLNESFEIGQQLLDNRKIFAEKFSKILTPQQVLKLYQMEGKFRDKMLDKKYD